MLRKFDSGVMVIQNKSHSDEEVIPFIFKLFHFVWKHFVFIFEVYFFSIFKQRWWNWLEA